MKISAIIPAYNAGPFLDETLRHVFAQTRLPDEVIVVNDGSADDTDTICQRWRSKIVYRPQANAGVSAARNAGAEAATGTHLIFIDADDCLLPGGLATLAAALALRPVAVAYGWTRLGLTADAPKSGKPSGNGPPPGGALASFWKSAITTPGAALLSAETFRAAGGFPPGLEGAEDRAFWMKCGALAEFVFCDEPIIAKRLVPNSVSQQRDRNIYRYMLAQMAFLEWCPAHRLDPAIFRTSPTEIVDKALQTALVERCWKAVADLLAYARQHGLESPVISRSTFYTRCPRAVSPLISYVESSIRTRWARKARPAVHA